MESLNDNIEVINDMYRVEVWKFLSGGYGAKIDNYENIDIQEILNWIQDEYNFKDYTFYVFRNDKELSEEEKRNLGFYKDKE